jgi:hypothetical protein
MIKYAAYTAQQQPNALNQSTLFSDVTHGGLFERKPTRSIEERVMNVKNAWDPAHPDCKLKVCGSGPPALGLAADSRIPTSQALIASSSSTMSLQKAPSGNTDDRPMRRRINGTLLCGITRIETGESAAQPSGITECSSLRMVPVLATGWDDVKKRMDVQEQVAGVHQAKMKVREHPSRWCTC